MDQFHKSHSYYDTTNRDDEYATSKSSMYQSQSFAFCSSNYDSYQGFSDSKSSNNQVDQFQKSHSYYDTTHVDDEYSTSKASMNHSLSFAYGSHNYDSYQGSSDFRSTMSRFGYQEPIKEEETSKPNLIPLSLLRQNIY